MTRNERDNSDESFARFGLENSEIMSVTPRDLSIYNHFGALAIYNYMLLEAPNDRVAVMWTHDGGWDKLLKLAIKNKCPLHTNLREVDPEMLMRYKLRAIELGEESGADFLPEEWA